MVTFLKVDEHAETAREITYNTLPLFDSRPILSRFSAFADQAAERLRGSINPSLIRATRKKDYDLRRTLVIAGYPRSGTTWLAELLATIPKSAILFEPLDFRQVGEARRAGAGYDNFRRPDEHWPEGERFMRRVLEGRVLTSWTTSHVPYSRAVGVERWIVKFVRANQMLGWLVERFDILPPVLLIRHPCAVYASWISRGWPLVTHPVPAGLRFFSAYPEHLEWVRMLRTPEEIFAAQWAMQHFTAFDQMRSKRYYLCVYEKMIIDGPKEVRRILSYWNIDTPTGIDTVFSQPSAKASASLAADGESQLAAWKSKLDDGTIKRIIAVLARFGLDFYGTNPQPDYVRLDRLVRGGSGREA